MSVQRLQLARAFQTFQGKGATGPRALIVAIVTTAALDLEGDEPGAARSAAAYFLSDLYRHHVTLAGLPPDYLPEGVTVEGLQALADALRPRALTTARRSATAAAPVAGRPRRAAAARSAMSHNVA